MATVAMRRPRSRSASPVTVVLAIAAVYLTARLVEALVAEVAEEAAEGLWRAAARVRQRTRSAGAGNAGADRIPPAAVARRDDDGTERPE
jgi:hypothetical protein